MREIAKLIPAGGIHLALCMFAFGCSAQLNDGSGSDDSTALMGAATLSATAVSASEVDLSWTTSLTGVNQIVVKRGSSSSSLSALVTLSPPASSYKDTTVSTNTTYYYRVIVLKGNVHYGSPIVSL
jgi:hypothetical protein